jgi:hypothetical protein
MPTCPGYMLDVAIQAMHDVRIAGPQSSGEPTVAAADVRDKPSRNAGRLDDLPSGLLWRTLLVCRSG